MLAPVHFIKSWSPSRLQDFERCKLAAKLKYLDKIPEPERPLPPGKTEHANDRGTRIHDGCERYVNGTSDEMPPEAERYFGFQIELLREMFKDGMVSLEGNWGMDRDWNIAPWEDAWLRLKLDVMVHHSETEATVIDYKSGRKYGNEIKHAEQLQQYQLVSFLRYPKLERVTTELWYLDQDEITRQTFTRDQGMRFKANYDRRGNNMTSCVDFPPNPSIFTCRWCQYDIAGHCPVGVKK